MLKRTDIFTRHNLEKLLAMQDSLDLNLKYWEGKHREYSHSSEIAFGEGEYTLTVKIYEEQQHPTYNKRDCS